MAKEQKTAQSDRQKGAKWSPPRGIRFIEMANCPENPHAVQWRTDGKRKTRNFPTIAGREVFARSLVANSRTHGILGLRLDEHEAREWRAFKAEIGADAPLDAVRDCWLKHGKTSRAGLTIREAVEQFTAAKTLKGIATSTLGHYAPVYARFVARFGNRDVASITREEIAAWVESTSKEAYTRRTHQVRVKALFKWLKLARKITDNPCDGLEPVRIIADEVEFYPLESIHSLFANNEQQPRELLGRLALECFAGLRFSSAAAVNGARDIHFESRDIILPAHSIKTRRREVISRLPDNLWWWLEWSGPASWSMTPRQYLEAKSNAVIRAKVERVHNGCRHSFATHHVAAFNDAAKTALILCHRNQTMLFRHYRGVESSQARALSYFQICPSDWCSVWPQAVAG